jgi:hypothetical protein
VSDWYPAARVVLISYLAVRPGHRGTGIGGLLYRNGLARWSRDLSPELVLGEVQDMSNPASTAYGDPAARLRFYERFGAQALGIPYFQPALRPGTSRVFGMLLMVFAATPGARSGPHRIDGAIVERFILEYLRDCENAVREHDEELHRVIEACHQQGGIPLRDVATILAAHSQQRHGG